VHFSPFPCDILRSCFLIELSESIHCTTYVSEWKPGDAPGGAFRAPASRPHLGGNGHEITSARNEEKKFAAWASDGAPGRTLGNLATATAFKRND
jgi:hypothetical protein